MTAMIVQGPPHWGHCSLQRGNNRSACFFAEEDYRFYLDHLSELSGKVSCAVHAYVILKNFQSCSANRA